MNLKLITTLLIVSGIFACTKQNQSSDSAEMYEPSELSQMMRDMVTWSKETKSSLLKGEVINDVPKQFYDLANQKATRDEHKDADTKYTLSYQETCYSIRSLSRNLEILKYLVEILLF